MSFVDLLRAPKRPTALSGQWPLDMPLVQFSSAGRRHLDAADACPSTVIFGSTGSGKTSGSGQLLALKFLKEASAAWYCVLTSKKRTYGGRI